jgi:diguanylate cyclase (GGDEF)-like protein
MNLKILHIEDDEIVQMAVKRRINADNLPYSIDAAPTISEALKLLEENSYDLAILDYKLPDGTGIDLLPMIKKIPVIFVTGSGDAMVAVKALRGGAYDYLVKDINNEYIELLPSTIEKVMRSFYLEEENKKNAEQLAIMNEELSRMYEEAKDLSLKDPLTGLANRRMMEIEFDRNMARVKRYGSPLSIIMMDIDYFKRYNDTHGHPAGDRLLAEVAGIVKEELREVDLAARYGGEEFIFFLPDIELEGAVAVAERIRKAVQDGSAITVSLGVASYHDGVGGKDELVKNVDSALYQAKEKGRNRVEAAL